MSKNSKRRRRIFDRYSKNWIHFSKYMNLPKDWKDIPTYACPMCMSVYDESALDQSLEKRLTLEDVPPHTLKGKPIILTCNSCNNSSGTGLDVHLLDQTKALNVLSRKIGGKKKVEFKINDKSTVKGELENLPNNTVSIKLDKTKNPFAKEDLDYLYKNWHTGGKISVSIRGGNLRRLEVAKLRIAYLLMFAKFGYGFILNHTLDPIREQILNPTKEILKHTGVVHLDLAEDMDGIFIIKQPKELVSFLVIYNIIESGHETKVSVVLPSPHPDSFSIYDEMKPHKGLSKIIFEKIPNLKYLEDPELATASLSLWKTIKKGI